MTFTGTILGRYVFRQAAGAVVLILVSLTGVTWIAVALRQIELMTSQGQGTITFLKMTTLTVPTLMAFIAPIAVLLASLQVMSRLNGDSELIVMTAGGAPAWRLLKPLLLLAVIAASFVLLNNHVIGPSSQRLLREYAVQIRTDLISQVIQPGRFTTPEPNLTIHIRDRSPQGELLGLLMHDARDEKAVSSYLAERGTIIKQGKASYLLMQNGHIVRRSSPEQAADIIVFDRYAIDLARFEQRLDSQVVLKPRERSTYELMNPDPNDVIFKSSPGRYLSELHDRFATALYPFTFVFLALAFAGQAATTRQSRTQGVVWGFAAAIGARVAGIATANAAVGSESAVFWMYAVPLGVIILAAVLVQANMSPRPPPRFVRVLRQRQVRARAVVVGGLARVFGRHRPQET